MAGHSEYRTTFRPALAVAITKRSPLVGRDEDMRCIEAALARAANGRGGTVFLSGETGIGKTRLAQEAMATARACGYHSLQGRAYPLDGRLAYAAIIDALGPFLRNQDPTNIARLVNGLPDLGRIFTDLHLPAPEPLGEPALERTRLFEAMARLLERIAREAPVALFLDDLHWADPASLEMLHYLARGFGDQPILLLATYRSDEVDAVRGLRPLLRSLKRAELSEKLNVQRLNSESVGMMARGLLDGEVLPEALELIVTRTGGTPLFVEALIRFLVDSGHLVRSNSGWGLGRGAVTALPESVRELVLDRLERLDPSARRVLELIAVGADIVPHAVLQAASGIDDDSVLMALQQLRAAGMIADQPDGVEVAYVSKHPFIQEVAYAEIPEVVRRRDHLLFTAAIERLRPGNLVQLARHYQGAGSEADPSRALEVLLAAGEKARGVHANDEAAQYFSAALALVRDGYGLGVEASYPVETLALPAGAANGSRSALLPWVLVRLGEAWVRVGKSDSAIACWNEALADYERNGKMTAIARVRRLLAFAEWDRGRFEAAESHLEAGLAALAECAPSLDQAGLLYARVFVLLHAGKFASLAAAVTELVSVADRLGLPSAEVDARLGELSLCISRWQFASARQCGLLALAVAERTSGSLHTLRVHNSLALLAVLVGDHAQLHHHAEHGLQLARHLGAPSLETLPRCHLAYADLLSGRLEAAQRRSFEAVLLARRVDQRRGLALALAVRALVLAFSGDLAEATECVAEARAIFAHESNIERFLSCMIGLGELTIALERDDAETLRARLAGFTPVSGSATFDLPPLLTALIAEALVAAGEVERALILVRQLAENGSADHGYLASLAARVEGRARQASGERKAALACHQRAAELFADLDMSLDSARARLEWATLVADEDPASAIAALQTCLKTFDPAGARLYATRTRRLFSRLGVHHVSGARPAPSPTSQTSSRVSKLSARELEVARLVADGLTSAEIAERLTISTRTVTTHLERIYARLGINSRVALVRYLGENVFGLLPARLRR